MMVQDGEQDVDDKYNKPVARNKRGFRQCFQSKTIWMGISVFLICLVYLSLSSTNTPTLPDVNPNQLAVSLNNHNHPKASLFPLLAPNLHAESILRSLDNLKIYVYDLPASFNHRIAARRPWCETESFGTEIYIHQALLRSPHRTLDPEEADFFYVPVYSACVVYRNFGNFRAYRYLIQKSLLHVQHHYPFWNKTAGRDHVWSFVHDFGGCLSWHDHSADVFLAPLRNSIFISHLGDLNLKCFNTYKDIVVPPYCSDTRISEEGLGGLHVDPSERKHLVYFRGTISWYHGNPVPNLGIQRGFDDSYSHGVRQNIMKLYENDTSFFIREGSSKRYIQEIQKSTYCLCPRGYAVWSRRLFDSVSLGCVPVIIADGIELPFEQLLDYRKFSVKILEKDVPRLKEILMSIPAEELSKKQKELQRVHPFFTYHIPFESGDAFDLLLFQLAQKKNTLPPLGPAEFW